MSLTGGQVTVSAVTVVPVWAIRAVCSSGPPKRGCAGTTWARESGMGFGKLGVLLGCPAWPALC